MPRKLPPLSALRAFEATARLGSVTRAGEELGRTHGAVSRQLRSLQDHAGVELFEKAGTGLRLNERGEALRQVVAGSLDALEQGWLRVLEEARGPSVHVACSATFAMRWLVPHLQGFYRRHPEIRLRLSMTSAQEIRHQGADLVLVWDRRSYPARDRERAIRLTDIAFGPVCAPGHAITRDGERLVCSTRIAHEHSASAWETWQVNTGLTASHEAELFFPHTHLCIEAALAGLGVALVEQRMVGEDLAAGRLVAPCGFVPFADGLAAIPARDHGVSPAARAFLVWIAEEFAAEAAAH